MRLPNRRSRRDRGCRALREASAEIGEWEKRKSVAQADLVNDLLLAEKDHNDEQVALADDAMQLQ